MNNINEKRQQTLDKVNKAIDELSVLPTAAAQFMALSISGEQYFEKVKALAEQATTFTAGLINVANSAVNASIHQITSISHAVSRIGTRQIKGLMTIFAIAKIFVPKNKSELNLWIHSI